MIDTITSVFALRGEITIISLIALIWSASAAFTTLTFNIDLAWLEETRPNPLKARLVGLLMIVIVYVILLVTLVGAALANMVAVLPLQLLDQLGVSQEVARGFGVQGITVLVSIGVFFALYWWVPSKKAPWSAALLAAVLAALASWVVDAGFSLYLSSRFARYELVYGPIASIIVLMFWFYLRVTIILIGAHLTRVDRTLSHGSYEISDSLVSIVPPHCSAGLRPCSGRSRRAARELERQTTGSVGDRPEQLYNSGRHLTRSQSAP